jgi:hypothetical protein
MDDSIQKLRGYAGSATLADNPPSFAPSVREASVRRKTGGSFADIVGFRAQTIDSPATYEDPTRAPVGIEFVYRNGSRAVL